MAAEGIHVLNEHVRPTSMSLYMDDHVLSSTSRAQSEHLIERAALLSQGSGADTSYGIENCFGMAEKGKVEKKGIQENSELLQRTADGGRHPCLDVIRIICIGLVCVDHGGTSFGAWNVMYVQAWVLQYLFLICGICFGVSSKTTGGFVWRLASYFCAGVFCNLCAYVILGLDWMSDLFNMVFQFWFVAALMGFIVALAPLKAHLCSTVEKYQEVGRLHTKSADTFAVFGPISPATAFTLLCGGYAAFHFIYSVSVIPLMQTFLGTPLAALVRTHMGKGAEFWGLPMTSEDGREFIGLLFVYLRLSASNIYIVVCTPMLSVKLPLVGWLVLINTYAQKMVLYRAAEARMINGFDCAMLGLVCYYYGLYKRRVIGAYLVRYWFVLLFLCACLWPPGKVGRFDEFPPEDLLTRARDNFLELIFVVLFLTAAERMIDPEIFTTDRLEYLGNWAFAVFLVHKAVHLLVPAPMNWVVLLSLAAPFCLAQYASDKVRKLELEKPLKAG